MPDGFCLQTLTDQDVARLAGHFTPETLETLALAYFNISYAEARTMRMDNIGNSARYKRELLICFRNKTSVEGNSRKVRSNSYLIVLLVVLDLSFVFLIFKMVQASSCDTSSVRFHFYVIQMKVSLDTKQTPSDETVGPSKIIAHAHTKLRSYCGLRADILTSFCTDVVDVTLHSRF